VGRGGGEGGGGGGRGEGRRDRQPRAEPRGDLLRGAQVPGRGEDRGDHGDAEHATEPLQGVVHPGGLAHVRGRDGAQRRGRRGGQRPRDAHPGDDERQGQRGGGDRRGRRQRQP